MTFDAYFKSAQDGDLIELLTFARNNTLFNYTSAEADYTDTTVSPNVTYTSYDITTDKIASTVELARTSQNIVVPRDFPIAELYRVTSPTDVVTLNINWVHRSDGEKVDFWFGRIVDVEWNKSDATIRCEQLITSMREPGLRRAWSVGCVNDLYGTACGLNKADFVTNTTVQAISGNTITVGALGSYSTYVGGFVEWVDSDGNTERRFIDANSGPTGSPIQNILTLIVPFNGLSITSPLQSVAVYPGCLHNLTGCNDDFSNTDNYGGQPFWPEKDLFGGDLVF